MTGVQGADWVPLFCIVNYTALPFRNVYMVFCTQSAPCTPPHKSAMQAKNKKKQCFTTSTGPI